MQTNSITSDFLWTLCAFEIPMDNKATELQFQSTLIQVGPSTSMTFISVLCILK